MSDAVWQTLITTVGPIIAIIVANIVQKKSIKSDIEKAKEDVKEDTKKVVSDSHEKITSEVRQVRATRSIPVYIEAEVPIKISPAKPELSDPNANRKS